MSSTSQDTARPTTFTGWAIDRDYLAEPGERSRVGYGQRLSEAQQTEDNYNALRRVIELGTDLTAAHVHDPVRFRLLDDDGEIYYGGAISREWLDGDEFLAFAPLRFGEADAGATDLQYRADDGTWKTL